MKKNIFIFLLIILLAAFLRFFKLADFPPGLYSDEAALGYNAFSVLQTGKDEYGKSWPLTFQSFGDYKPPLSVYFIMPAVALFGLDEFSVRLPFALFGVLSVVLIYFLALEIFQKIKEKQLIAQIAALLLAVSPWHLHQSRCAMLVGLEVFFNALGVYLFLQGLKRSYFYALSALSFSLAVYAYYGSRITSPLIILVLIIFYRKIFFKNFKNILIFLSGFIILLPLFWAIYQDPQTLLGRARFMSIFYDKNVWGQLWEARTLDGPASNPLLTRFFHNKPFYYLKDFIKRYLQHFNTDFLFVKGELTAPFQIPGMGVLYLLDLPFLIIALLTIFRQKLKNLQLIVYWLLVSPVVAALTFMTPASNRSFNLVFPLYLLLSWGIFTFLQRFPRLKYRLLLVFVVYLPFIGFYLYQYYINIPRQIPQKWYYGKRELVEEIGKLQDGFEKVVLSDKGGPPYIFLLFFQKYPPENYWQSVKVNSEITQLGWGHIDSFDKYQMPRDFDWEKIEKKENVLYVTFGEEVGDDYKILKKVYFPDGQVAYKIFYLQK